MKKSVSYRYGLLRGMDIFFSHHTGMKGRLIRYSCARKNGRKAARRARKDRSLPNHGGFITDHDGQKYITEVTGRNQEALRQNCFEKYRTRRNQIIRVFRWAGFEVEPIRRAAQEALALEVRRGTEQYDWWGAITSSWLGRKVFFWMKNDPEKNYCTEYVCKVLAEFGMAGQLPRHQNPMALMAWMEQHPDFVEVKGVVV